MLCESPQSDMYIPKSDSVLILVLMEDALRGPSLLFSQAGSQ